MNVLRRSSESVDTGDERPDPPQPAARRAPRTISIPVWAVVVAVLLAASAVAWPTVQRQLLTRSARPPASKTSLPEYKNVPKYSLAYSGLPASSALVLSDFEAPEAWRGTGLDASSKAPFEGALGLGLRSIGQAPAVITLTTRLDLSQIHLIEIYARTSAPTEVQSLKLSFLSQSSPKSGFEYPFAVTTTGWFPIRMQRDQFSAFGGATDATWADIGAIVISLVSRPRADATVSFDLLRAEGDPALYIGGWEMEAPQDLGIISTRQGRGLLLRSAVGRFAAMAAVGDAKNFIVTAQLSPLAPGRGGLLLRGDLRAPRGYSFVLGGLGSSNWELLRTAGANTVVVAQGTVGNTTFSRDAVYWLRAIVKGKAISLSFSSDGLAFTTVGGVESATFPFGSVGLSVWDSSAYAVYKVDYERTP